LTEKIEAAEKASDEYNAWKARYLPTTYEAKADAGGASGSWPGSEAYAGWLPGYRAAGSHFGYLLSTLPAAITKKINVAIPQTKDVVLWACIKVDEQTSVEALPVAVAQPSLNWVSVGARGW
jgi:hypothetical protein